MSEDEREEFQTKIAAQEPNTLLFDYALAIRQDSVNRRGEHHQEKINLMEAEIIGRMWQAW